MPTASESIESLSYNQRLICTTPGAMDELKAALAERGTWYLFHAHVHRSSPAALRARETGIVAAPERAPSPKPRDGDDDEDQDDSWKLYFDYLTPAPALKAVPPEDQRVMDEVLSLVLQDMPLAAVQTVPTVASATDGWWQGIVVGVAHTRWPELFAQCCVKRLHISHARRIVVNVPSVADTKCTCAQYAVGRWGFAGTPRHIYSRQSARVMLARHLSGSMAYGPLKCTAQTEHEADLFISAFADPKARFYCNWLGPSSFSPIGIPGEDSHTFEVIMVGIQADQIAAVANWDED